MSDVSGDQQNLIARVKALESIVADNLGARVEALERKIHQWEDRIAHSMHVAEAVERSGIVHVPERRKG